MAKVDARSAADARRSKRARTKLLADQLASTAAAAAAAAAVNARFGPAAFDDMVLTKQVRCTPGWRVRCVAARPARRGEDRRCRPALLCTGPMRQ